MQHQRTTTHGTRSGDKPPRSFPSLAKVRSVGSSGSDGGLAVATKHRSPPVGRGRRLVAPLPPSQPSSQKAVSCTLFVNSQGAGLICARGTSPLARLCYRSSAEEKWFGFVLVRPLRLGVSAPSTSSVSACCLVSARETPSRWSGVITADTTVSSSFLLRNGTATADTFVVRGSDHQSESKCATGPVGSAIVRQLKRGCTVLLSLISYHMRTD